MSQLVLEAPKQVVQARETPVDFSFLGEEVFVFPIPSQQLAPGVDNHVAIRYAPENVPDNVYLAVSPQAAPAEAWAEVFSAMVEARVDTQSISTTKIVRQIRLLSEFLQNGTIVGLASFPSERGDQVHVPLWKIVNL